MFPPSELKGPGSNLGRFSLFIYFTTEMGVDIFRVFIYPLFFFLIINVYLRKLTVSQVLIYIEGLRNKYLDH